MLIKRSSSGHRCGESHPRSRISDSQVREMRHMHHQLRKSIPEIARMHGVSYFTAYDIINFKTRVSA